MIKLPLFRSCFLVIRSQSPQSHDFPKLPEFGRYTWKKCWQVQKEGPTTPLPTSGTSMLTFSQFSPKKQQFNLVNSPTYYLMFFIDSYQILGEKYYWNQNLLGSLPILCNYLSLLSLKLYQLQANLFQENSFSQLSSIFNCHSLKLFLIF